MSGKVTVTFAQNLPNWAWAFINGQWLRIDPSGGADSVTNMFTQLVAARTSGITVNVSLNASNQIQFVLY
jgi:hypothetical protein